MAEPKAKTGSCHDAPTSTPSGLKVKDHAVSYEGSFRVDYVVQSITNFGRPLDNATTGWIESDAEPGVRLNATSGWKHTDARKCILNDEVYAARVLKVAKDISFNIPNHKFDNPGPRRKPALPHHFGRFNACHIEKKLSVWWVEKVLYFCFKTKDLTRMHELSGLELPARMTRATVVLNHAPCKNCLDFLDEIHRLTGIRVSTREILFLEPFKRERAQEYPQREESDDEGDEEAVEQDRPETPRPTVARKVSDPKVAKGLAYSSPPPRWEVFSGTAVPCAKPARDTKVTLEQMRKMYGGELPTSQPTQDESRSAHDNPGLSEPSSQSEDETMQDAEHQNLSENDRRFSDSPSLSPFPGAGQLRESRPCWQLQVRLPYISPEIRAHYRLIETDDEVSPQPSLAGEPEPSSPAPISEKTTCKTPPPHRLPNLNRFIYGGGKVTPAKRPARQRTRKPKGLTRAEKARKKSTFLKAANRATLQRAQVQGGHEERDRQPVPVSGTGGGHDEDDDEPMVTALGTGGGGADDDDEDVPMMHPSFMEEYGLDVVMG